MSSTAAEGGLPDLVSLLQDARVVDTNGVAAAALLAYDIVLTWGSEYELVWRSRTSLPKFLYIFIRYFGLALLLVGSAEASNTKVTDKVCRSFTLYNSIASQLVIVAVQATLAIRVYALFGRTKPMMAIIGGLFLGTIITMFTITGVALQKIVSVPAPAPLSGCFGVNIPSYFTYVWTPSLCFECFLFILTLYQLYQTVKTRAAKMPITTLFFRDGTVYFAVAFVAFFIQTILYHQKNAVLAQVAICWLQALLCIAGPRLLLNLRDLAQRHEDAGTRETWWSTFGPEPAHDDLAFRMGPTTHVSASSGTTVFTDCTEGETVRSSMRA
ncbi:hypothetical protein PHLGIDRAFT_37096 [Phlebiopsis gigantea 11061_1 CR5-6]|uniref:DUF6533 domain-containing protein n=1 Tax=Phlebiopsis gigantea (strain 11061_1 CR5-6) TaxID=745531 RepID=A0A0C3NH40_PHLG1|nr:hypothetical protein PHLGIDRAFT_37096 [Phlebiopsis gigantea 11061_1 CR5-6]